MILFNMTHHLEKYEFVNFVRIVPCMKWKIKVMFETTNQIKIHQNPCLTRRTGDLTASLFFTATGLAMGSSLSSQGLSGFLKAVQLHLPHAGSLELSMGFLGDHLGSSGIRILIESWELVGCWDYYGIYHDIPSGVKHGK